jgi:nucleoside-diphosphate-sugar epimerase
MAILVTGGAGFLGSHLVDRLVENGEEVAVIDDLSTGRIANLERALSSGRATFIYGDVGGSTDAVGALVKPARVGRLTAIYHLASPASPDAYAAKQRATLAANGIGTHGCIELALAHGATLVFASTSEVYGDPHVHPQPETYFGNVNPVGPRSCYDEGKRYGEALVAAAIRENGLRGRIVRLFNAYGPRMSLRDGRLIPSLLEAVTENRPMPIHGSGQQTRSMTYVEDVVNGLLLIEAANLAEPWPVNLGGSEEQTVLEIARRVATIAGVAFVATHLDARPEDPQRRSPDLTRAWDLGWRPQTSFNVGMRATYEWWTADALLSA